MDDLLEQFLIEARELSAQAARDLAVLTAHAADVASIDSAFRAIHTLKGSVAIFDMAPAERALHAGEDLLARARTGGNPLSAQDVAGLIALIDQTDRWIDAMEQAGALSAASSAESEAVVLGLRPAAAPVSVNATDPDWLSALRQRENTALGEATGPLVAFRYMPDSECFFRGDDPIGVCAQVPELIAFAVLPAAPWAPLDRFEPFHCSVVLEGVSRADEASLRAVFRLFADQVSFATILPDMAEAAAPGPAATARSLRVEVARIDALADGVGELIVANNALAHVAADVARVDARAGAMLRDAHAALERAVGTMRDAIAAVRMVPLAPSLQRLPRMVREIAATLGKPVAFTLTGEGTQVDKGIADQLFEPLLHLVRNALDHGIEDAATRAAAGKPGTGALDLAILRDGDQLQVGLRDDGAGIDAAQIRDIAVARGLIARDSADALDEAQALRLIFAAGFSTATQVTSLSGRGVGMDAVRAVAEQLGGRVDIATTLGQGTRITLHLPLNAIMTRLLIVRAGGERYGIPLDRIVETASVAAGEIRALGGGLACVLRNRTLPVLSLPHLLGGRQDAGGITRLLVTEHGGERVGLIVDGFEQRIDGLVRPRSGLLSSVPGIAGTMLMGDGGVLLILDLESLTA